jgi:RNase H-fold protein (predicted Holliday junction resolvase)
MDRQRPVLYSWKSALTRRLGTRLHKTLQILIGCLDESKVGVVAIGGMEAVAEIIKTFPNCQAYYIDSATQVCMLQYWREESRRNVWNRILLAACKQSLGLCLHM